MNCKPGDLAIIIADAPTDKTAGQIVEVLYRAPIVRYRLPCGQLAAGAHPESWVVKFQRPVLVPISAGGTRAALYAACPDRYLRPLPPPEQIDVTEAEKELIA